VLSWSATPGGPRARPFTVGVNGTSTEQYRPVFGYMLSASRKQKSGGASAVKSSPWGNRPGRSTSDGRGRVADVVFRCTTGPAEASSCPEGPGCLLERRFDVRQRETLVIVGPKACCLIRAHRGDKARSVDALAQESRAGGGRRRFISRGAITPARHGYEAKLRLVERAGSGIDFLFVGCQRGDQAGLIARDGSGRMGPALNMGRRRRNGLILPIGPRHLASFTNRGGSRRS